MKPIRIVAIVLIAAGILGLAYGGFSYTKESHEAKLGPIDITVKEKKKVNVPAWAGAGAIIIGGILFFIPGKPS
jgi:TRAP-type C4-dicarboxylate transport system permease small subunit